MDAESTSPREKESWLEIEEAPQFMAKNKQQLGDKRRSLKVNVVLVALMIVPALVILLGGRIGAPAVWVTAGMAGLRRGSQGSSFLHTTTAHDKLLGGLLAVGFDEESCHSRYQSAMYRRNPGRQPSRYLISKLRSHEALQRKCGPNTASYSRALEQLRSGNGSVRSPECKYLVSISYRGLGNRILAAASAFLYALLTDRVLLIDPSNEMDELFCEPFPGTTWLLPPGFPLMSYQSFYLDTAERYGNMRRNSVLRTDVTSDIGSSAVLPAFAYIHLDYNLTDYDHLFFCDEDQRLLLDFQWLVMRTDSYIVPGLFLVAAFQEELAMLFPERDAVFHHLGRYLFHPTNHVWGLITRYYRSHLAAGQRRVGIQVRVFSWQPESPDLLEQITTCAQKENLLPEVLATEEPAVPAASSGKIRAVLITSLKSWYYEKIRGMYWENATANGEVVTVDQPSHEEYQHYNEKSHDWKAWAEIYLLSLTDALVTTGKSTFGYVAQGLGGLRPWMLHNMGSSAQATDPPCRRAVSMEPCFHVAPLHDCKRRQDTGKIVPYVQHCQDVPTGLKLVDRNEW